MILRGIDSQNTGNKLVQLPTIKEHIVKTRPVVQYYLGHNARNSQNSPFSLFSNVWSLPITREALRADKVVKQNSCLGGF